MKRRRRHNPDEGHRRGRGAAAGHSRRRADPVGPRKKGAEPSRAASPHPWDQRAPFPLRPADPFDGLPWLAPATPFGLLIALFVTTLAPFR
ncbi:MAG: hypothetical protein JW751_11110 [Polyangiaceae bacterium]|nr:hypothetical protein [Polyangiaceae bacterium]